MEIYMINGGNWTDYAWKLVITALALLVAIYDWKRNKRNDYLWLFLIATIYWAGAEYLMHLIGIRTMPNQQIFGIDLPLEIGVLIQGTARAASPAVTALFIADRLAMKETKNWKEGVFGIFGIKLGIPLLSLVRFGVSIPDVGGAVGSRRNIFDPVSNLFAITMKIFIVVWMMKTNPETRRRTFYYYFGVIIGLTFFTVVSVFGGNRWIEVGPESGPWTCADPLLEFAIHVYFITIQEMAKFVPFFILPCLFGLIKLKNH
jgi:hypothetical protein